MKELEREKMRFYKWIFFTVSLDAVAGKVRIKLYLPLLMLILILILCKLFFSFCLLFCKATFILKAPV